MLQLSAEPISSLFRIDNNGMPTVVAYIEYANEAHLQQLIKCPNLDSTWRKKLMAYTKCNVGPNQFRIEYTYSKYSILEYGRLWARGGIGLQMFPKEIRAFLASEYYLDIDMENAMFRLLKSLAEQLNLDVAALCPELIELIENRKQVLTQQSLAKTDVIRMIFTSNSKPRNTFIRKIHTFFYGEVVPLLTSGQHNYWSAVWEHVQLLRQRDIRGNKEGCFLSLIYQTFEKQCLTSIMDNLKSQNFEAHVPIFDGALVLKSPQLADIPALLKDCESYVQERTHFEVVLLQKDFFIPSEFLTHWHLQVVPAATLLTKRTFEDGPDEDDDDEEEGIVVLPIPEDEVISISRAKKLFNNGQDPKSLLRYLNNFFAKVTEEDTAWFCYREKRSDPWIWRDKATTSTCLSHLSSTYQKTGKSEKTKTTHLEMFRFWYQEPKLLTFKKIVMNPRCVGDRNGYELNLFRGFKATRLDSYDETILAPIFYHLREVINGGVEEHWRYLEGWLASMVQNPEDKNRTAIVLHGSQGTGKNILFEWFGQYIIGKDHYLYLNDLDDLTGRFTSLQSAKIFVLGDEVVFAGAHKTNNILKSKITQAWQKCEKKGCDPLMIEDFMNLCFLSNNDDAVKIEDTCRRYYVKRVSDKHRNAQEYFAPLCQNLTQETADHFYTYLMSLDLSKFNVRNIPHTEEKEDMRVMAMNPLDLFVEEMLDGGIVHEKGKWDEETKTKSDAAYFQPGEKYQMTMVELFERYVEFYGSSHSGCVRHKGLLGKKAFGKVIRRKLAIENATQNRNGGTKIKLTVARPT
ncbi:hypothetical protein DFS34DRAFT_654286 [Phlyctochytrium arcticum]|nr:hypothetical protein DFS34DRAFT_654286 [Phlyctochytrium arcticum]